MKDETSTKRDVPDPLVRELLHAMGQPLTALQMCVLLRDSGGLRSQPMEDPLAEMADQVTLLSRLFVSLRTLLEFPSGSVVAPASALERHVLDRLPRWQERAAARKILIATEGLDNDSCGTERFARDFVLQTSLENLFEAALLSLPDDGCVQIAFASPDDSTYTLRLQGGERLPEDSFSARYALPVARALLESGRQGLAYTVRPFAAVLTVSSRDAAGTPETLCVLPAAAATHAMKESAR